MKALYIDGRRNGYAPWQCGETMTVRELIDFLEQYDDDTPVYLKNDNGYTYGNINWDSFDENDTDYEDEEEDDDETN